MHNISLFDRGFKIDKIKGKRVFKRTIIKKLRKKNECIKKKFFTRTTATKISLVTPTRVYKKVKILSCLTGYPRINDLPPILRVSKFKILIHKNMF